MIQEMYSSFVLSASRLGDFQSMSKTELANGYCDADDAHDESKKDQYFSALMLRYWYKIYDFFNESQSAQLELEDFVSWVAESLNVGLKYRRWRDSSHPLSKDQNGPDKVFNRCFFSTRKRWYVHFNKDKRKINYLNPLSIEEFEEYGDLDLESPSKTNEKIDRLLYTTKNYSELESESASVSVVQSYLNEGKILEAIIIDAIAHQDTFDTKVTKKKTDRVDEQGQKIVEVKSSSSFNNRKLAKQLTTIDDKYLSYFNSTYSVNQEKLTDVINQLNKTPNKKLYRYINRTLSGLREDKKIIDMLTGSI